MSTERRLRAAQERLQKLLPDPDAEEREAEFRRQLAILEVMHELVYDYPGPLKDYTDEWEDLVKRAVPKGLLAHDLSGEEVEELTPLYVAMFLEGDDEPTNHWRSSDTW